MLFIKTEDLKIGMRLAKPIYNNKGVLLYERNSKLTKQGIESARNFGLIGIYILEPAEPLPPMTADDIEFERFQTVSVFTIRDELQSILTKGKQVKLFSFAESIIKSYGRLDRKINFVQNLRSKEDFVYKHSLNVALLCTMMSHHMNMRREEQRETVVAALVHDIGKLNIPEHLGGIRELTQQDQQDIKRYEFGGIQLAEQAFLSMPNIKRTVMQAYKQLDAFHTKKELGSGKLVTGAKLLIVAETYDTMTAMNSIDEPKSEIATLKYLMAHPEIFGKDVVDALIKSINFLSKGCSVELSSGLKGLVLTENEQDILRPVILCFSNNTIIDLRQTMLYADLEIEDIMKTLDNRYVIDVSTAERFKEEQKGRETVDKKIK